MLTPEELEQLNAHIEKELKAYGYKYGVTQEDVPDIISTYDRIISFTSYKDATPQERESIISDLIIGKMSVSSISGKEKRKESGQHMFNRYSENRHMDYYDNFLAPGEADKIQKALIKAGYTSSVLKGIKKLDKTDIKIPGTNLRVVQEIGHDDNGSEYVEAFYIYDGDKLIYSFEASKSSIAITDNDNYDDLFEDFSNEEKEEQPVVFDRKGNAYKVTRINKPRKDKKQRQGRYLYTAYNTEMGDITVQLNKNGQVVGIDKKGHYVKKELYKR